RQHPAVDRADAVETGSSAGRAVVALDEGPAFDAQVTGALLPFGESQGGHGSSSVMSYDQKSTLNQRRQTYQYFLRSRRHSLVLCVLLNIDSADGCVDAACKAPA